MARGIYRLSADEKIRLQCEAREEYERQQRFIKRRMQQLEETEEKLAESVEKHAENEQKLDERD